MIDFNRLDRAAKIMRVGALLSQNKTAEAIAKELGQAVPYIKVLIYAYEALNLEKDSK